MVVMIALYLLTGDDCDENDWMFSFKRMLGYFFVFYCKSFCGKHWESQIHILQLNQIYCGNLNWNFVGLITKSANSLCLCNIPTIVKLLGRKIRKLKKKIGQKLRNYGPVSFCWWSKQKIVVSVYLGGCYENSWLSRQFAD